MEILILHPGGLGDIILALPAIASLRKQFPSAGIVIAGNTDHLTPLVRAYAERVVSLSTLPLHHLYASGNLPQTDVHFWKSFDRIVSWTGAGNPEFAARMKRMHPAVCIASWRPGPEEHRHVSQIFVDSLVPWIPRGSEAQPAGIQLDPISREQGLQWLAGQGWNGSDRLVALHPGAGSVIKRWPLPRFINFAQQLALQENVRFLIIEGPAETGLAGAMAQALPADKIFSLQSVPLNLLAALVERCGAFVGNDSGIAHLAAGLQVPSVVLFGPTSPQHWAPLGNHVTVLRNSHGCEACGSGRSNHTCLSRISVEDVIRALRFEMRN